MTPVIYRCACSRSSENHCSLTLTCKGWGCRFLATPINELPTTEKKKAKLFSSVYREAKHKGVLECPHYKSLFIDEVLEDPTIIHS